MFYSNPFYFLVYYYKFFSQKCSISFLMSLSNSVNTRFLYFYKYLSSFVSLRSSTFSFLNWWFLNNFSIFYYIVFSSFWSPFYTSFNSLLILLKSKLCETKYFFIAPVILFTPNLLISLIKTSSKSLPSFF